MHERVHELLEQFSRVEFERVCLLGMGGSSLAPEVLKRLFRVDTFETLDTTHPSAVRRVETDGTLFISASKSGSTLETRSHTEYFLEQVGKGDRFVAITDPGSELERLASERGFLDTIHGEPTIGGRYSALSPFGIVPAVLMGIDVHRLLDRAEEMREACRLDEGNPGLELGLELGAGPDKVLVEGDFGLWVEQLLAESTGKHGKGLVPVRYGDADDVQRPDFRVDDPYEVAQEFFRWEFATAVAGSILGINPFDQPDVQAAKDKTNELLSRGGASRPSSPRATSTSCSPARARATTSRSSRSSTRRARRSSRRSSTARARPAAPSPSGSARATSTRPASCTRAVRTPASSSRSSTTSARSCRSPGSSSASAH